MNKKENPKMIWGYKVTEVAYNTKLGPPPNAYFG